MPVVENADAVRVRVPAKVNLHLSVGAVRPDGFHELTTVFQAVALFDDVTARAATGLRVTADGAFALGVPVDHTNLAFGAAELLAAHAGTGADAVLELHKAIPVAGGMAGGSADAAGALRRLRRAVAHRHAAGGARRAGGAARQRRRRSRCPAAPRSGSGAASS